MKTHALSLLGTTRLLSRSDGFEFVLLLAGGDKSTQANDIQSALALARKLKEEK